MFARHQRHAAATRRAVEAWGSRCWRSTRASSRRSLTGVVMPEGHDADEVRGVILERFDMSLGAGLGGCRAGSSASATSATSTT